jgi:hypothetical protein
MSLDTQEFGISRYWLSTAVKHIPSIPDIFAPSKQLSQARKLFLAGNNQLSAIRNWLVAAGILEAGKGQVKLTELGQLIASQDPKSEMALTWWLFHLHLCTNLDAFPYSGFFLHYDSEGKWMAFDEIVDTLAKHADEKKLKITKGTVATYFGGVVQTFQAGGFVHEMGLVEQRATGEGRKLRRRLGKPEDLVVAYAAVLFQKQFFTNQATVEARELLGKGLARVLGMRDSDVREALSRITTHRELSQLIQYRQQVNQDSMQFLRTAEASLKEIRTSGYRTQVVKWH